MVTSICAVPRAASRVALVAIQKKCLSSCDHTAKLQVTLWLLHIPTSHIYPPPPPQTHTHTHPICTSSPPLLCTAGTSSGEGAVCQATRTILQGSSCQLLAPLYIRCKYAVSLAWSSEQDTSRGVYVCLQLLFEEKETSLTNAATFLVATCRPEHHLWAGAPE